MLRAIENIVIREERFEGVVGRRKGLSEGHASEIVGGDLLNGRG